MTSAAVTLEQPALRAAAARAPSRLTEFLLVGGATLLLFPLSWALRRWLGLGTAELAIGFLMFHGAHLINDPHFAVTYLLFYRDVRARALGRAFDPLQRARYWLAGLFVPLVLALWAGWAIGSNSARALGGLIQLMFWLVGWHYVKQGFGVLTVLSARRGVTYSPFERRVVLCHCFAGWAYAWSSPADSGRDVEEKGVVYATLAQPGGLEGATFVVFMLSAALLVWALGRKWRREGKPPPLAPLAGLLITVWLLTVFTGLDPLMMYMIPALHSVQYLYFVWLLQRNRAAEGEGPPLFGRPVAVQLGALAVSALGLGWLLFHGVPAALDGALTAPPGAGQANLASLGPTPYFAALFALVNIHHYFMDYVIWRRENPDTRYLRA